MPTSNWQNISYNIELIRKINPQSILDVGVGFGRWGILLREFLELWEGVRMSGNTKPDWKIQIDGLEIFPSYIKEYHKYFYNNIIIVDALAYIPKIEEKYDLIIFGDVIEHFEKRQGVELIKTSLLKSKYILINLPLGENWEQSGSENPFEEHKSIWSISDFKSYQNKIIKVFNDNVFRKFAVVLISDSEIKLNEKLPPLYNFKNFLKYKFGLAKLINKN